MLHLVDNYSGVLTSSTVPFVQAYMYHENSWEPEDDDSYMYMYLLSTPGHYVTFLLSQYVCTCIPQATNLRFMEDYGNRRLSMDEAGYYLTTLEAAAAYIENLSPENLKQPDV